MIKDKGKEEINDKSMIDNKSLIQESQEGQDRQEHLNNNFNNSINLSNDLYLLQAKFTWENCATCSPDNIEDRKKCWKNLNKRKVN